MKKLSGFLIVVLFAMSFVGSGRGGRRARRAAAPAIPAASPAAAAAKES